MSQPRGQVFSGTLVLIAPKGASASDMEDMCAKTQAVHKRPVIVLPSGWKAMDVAQFRAALDACERKPDASASDPKSLGTSKPPPPPPPPPT